MGSKLKIMLASGDVCSGPCGKSSILWPFFFQSRLTRLVIESTIIYRCGRQSNVNPKRKREMIEGCRIVKPRLSLSSVLACTSG